MDCYPVFDEIKRKIGHCKRRYVKTKDLLRLAVGLSLFSKGWYDETTNEAYYYLFINYCRHCIFITAFSAYASLHFKRTDWVAGIECS